MPDHGVGRTPEKALEKPIESSESLSQHKQPEESKPERKPNPYVPHLKEGYVGNFVKVMLSDPITREKFYDLFSDREIFKKDIGDEESLNYKITPMIASIMRDPTLRRLLVEASLHDMREKSKVLKIAIEGVQDKIEQGDYDAEVLKDAVYDELIIGAGIQASIANNTETAVAPNVKSITVERGDVISANFSNLKDFLKINSDLTANKKGLPLVGDGNLNYFGKNAIVQPSYIEGARYPTAKIFSDSAAVNQSFATNEMLMNTEVVRVDLPEDDPESDKWPARNRVHLNNGSVVFAERVVIMEGPGEPDLPKQFDEESKQVFEEGSKPGPDGLPTAMVYDTFASYTASTDMALRTFADKKIAIGGGGHGAATAVEYFLRLADPKAYGKDVAQVGDFKEIDWVGVKFKNKEEFIQQYYDRYADIAVGLPNKEGQYDHGSSINPVEAHIVKIRKSDDPTKGLYKLTYESTHTEIGPDGKETKSTSQEEVYRDVIILATGYKANPSKLFKDGEAFKNKDTTEEVYAPIDGLDGQVDVATKLKNQEVYQVGPIRGMAETFDSIKAKEQGVELNPAISKTHINIATYGPRSEAFMELMARTKKAKGLPRFDHKEKPVMIAPEISEQQSFSYPYELHRSSSEMPIPIPDEMTEFKLKYILGTVFQECTYDGDLKVIFEKKDNSGINLRFEPNLTEDCSEDIRSKLQQEALLVESLTAMVNRGRWNKITVDVPFNSQGIVKVPDINIIKSRS